MKRKYLYIVVSLITVISLSVLFSACTDVDTVNNSTNPICGNWICVSESDSGIYYMAISPIEYDENDKTTLYNLDCKMYGVFNYSADKTEWHENLNCTVGINPKYSDRYNLQAQFDNFMSDNSLYKIEMTSENELTVTGNEFAVQNDKYVFTRTELTLEEFKKEYYIQ